MTVPSKANAAFAIMDMADVEEATVARFVTEIPLHDLFFLERDIRQPKVLAAWRKAIERGSVHSLVAVADGEIVATTAVVREPLSWSAHVAEVRLLVLADWRGKGVGRALLQTSIDRAIANGAAKLTARMTPDQRGAITLFEETGFRGEALLRDHVRDADGQPHDLAILSLDVARAQTLREAFSVEASTSG